MCRSFVVATFPIAGSASHSKSARGNSILVLCASGFISSDPTKIPVDFPERTQRRCLPSGKNSGPMWRNACRVASTFVAGRESPPSAETRMIPSRPLKIMPPFAVPRSTSPASGSGAQIWFDCTRNLDLHQAPLREERDKAAVRRPKWICCGLSVWQHSGFNRGQISDPEMRSVIPCA